MHCFHTRLGFLREERRREAAELLEANEAMFLLTTQLAVSLPIFRLLPTPRLRRHFAAEDVLFQSVLFCLPEGRKEWMDGWMDG